MTCVSPEGRISPGCTGLYTAEHGAAWRRIVEFVHAETDAKIAIQLGHSGAKGSTQLGWEESDAPLESGNWPVLAPSALPWSAQNQTPREMTRADMNLIRDQFVQSAEMAVRVGFDWLELHYAHGYLMSSFITPITNRRTDEYGGTLENRMRFPLEVFRAVRKAWPDEKPISVRISAHDWVAPEGVRPQDAVEIARLLREAGVDLIDVEELGDDDFVVPFAMMGAPTVIATALGMVQFMTPAEMRARVLSLFTMISFGLQTFAVLIVGYLAERLGVATAIQINGIVLISAAVLMLIFRTEMRRWGMVHPTNAPAVVSELV
jgi:2,4-dienoyl-CoA reductase-like NADH-dependent reductase (Old Yellow Enzyme family)